MTITLANAARSLFATLRYQREQARRRRLGAKRTAELLRRLRVCRETTERGRRAVAEVEEARNV